MGRPSLKWMAIAGAAIALVFWDTTGLPLWSANFILVGLGLVSAGQFAHHYVCDPPSLARLEKLQRCGTGSVIGLAFGTGTIVGHLVSVPKSVPFFLMPTVSFLVVLIGMFAIS